LDKYRARISEFCIKVPGCGFSGLDAKCDEFGGKQRKARSKMSTYPNFVAV